MRRIVGIASGDIAPGRFDLENRVGRPVDGRIANCRTTCGREAVDEFGEVHRFWRNGERMGRFSAFWGIFSCYLVHRFLA
jgi:hypothetical protein